jgi:ankyrin repeat protein
MVRRVCDFCCYFLVSFILALMISGCEGSSENTFLTAATNNDLPGVQRLLDAGVVDVNYSAPNGESALITASALGYTEMVAFLLDRGANPKAAADDGQTALTMAAYHGYGQIVAMLLRSGADVDSAENRYGYTALAMACKEGHLDTVRLLLQANADVGIRTFVGKTPWQIARERGYGQIAELISAHATAH